MASYSLVLCTLALLAGSSVLSNSDEAFTMVHRLDANSKEIEINKNFDIQIFCRAGDRKTPLYYFRSATLRIYSAAEDIKLIKGPTPQDVYDQHKSSTWLFWIANIMPWRMRDASFPTFNTSCVGISTNQLYTARMVVRNADPWKVFLFAVGLILYFMSPKLAKSTLFFYSSATFVGAAAAALLILFLMSRMLPRGRGSYITLSVVYSIFLYFAGETWNRFEQLIQQRLPYVIVYLSLGAVVSIISCYRFGPPSNPKTLNIIQWSLQLVGLLLIHLSSDLVEVSTCLIIGLVSYNLAAEKIMYHAKKLKYRCFPPKPKFLTEEEYITQGAEETQKCLEELRKFCNSPECNTWKVVSRIKDPKRFSSFIEGESHLSDSEVMAYDSETEALEEAAAADLLTDDENGSNVTDDEC
ncbi:Nuclear envelope integral membrane protein 1b [Orchesella cincta]|uniref:Nuclear envelope integral membrane protein 1b n=1 Tax=Orchesella cincta TaxID=48709 RepID=A0A1D2NHY0_ORCCI|nr:Nuclear envelope integral membrane protein 1b [Orchesella cincta]